MFQREFLSAAHFIIAGSPFCFIVCINSSETAIWNLGGLDRGFPFSSSYMCSLVSEVEITWRARSLEAESGQAVWIVKQLVTLFLFSGYLFLLFLVFCFRDVFYFSKINIFIITSYDMEVGQGKITQLFLLHRGYSDKLISVHWWDYVCRFIFINIYFFWMCLSPRVGRK